MTFNIVSCIVLADNSIYLDWNAV